MQNELSTFFYKNTHTIKPIVQKCDSNKKCIILPLVSVAILIIYKIKTFYRAVKCFKIFRGTI